MLSPKIKRYLTAQKARLMSLDAKDEDFYLRSNVRPCIDEATGRITPGHEMIYDGMISWLNSREAARSLWDDFQFAESVIKEDTLSTDIATFPTAALPLVRRIHHQLVATQLVSVQPMKGPSSYIFYLNKKYGTAYPAESILTTDRTDEKNPTAYAGSAEKGTIRELNAEIVSKSITAENYKLKALWTLESEQDAQAQHLISIESEMVNELGDEIARELDRLIITRLLAGAAYNVDWNKNGNLGAGSDTTADVLAYRQTLYSDSLTLANAYILSKKGVNAGWAVMNATTFQMFQRLENFKLDGPAVNLQANIGIQQMGTLAGMLRVFVAPWFDDNKILLGMSPVNWKYACGVYAPYVPLFVSETYIANGDFSQRVKGAQSRFYADVIPDENDGTTNSGLATITIKSS